MENPMHRSLIAVALLLLAPLATAQVYKWTDASGTVHYSQAPPAEGTSYKKVTTTGSVEAPNPTPAANAVAKPADNAAASTEPLPDTPENRSNLCKSLTANLAALKGSAPVVMQKDGKATALDDSQRKQQAAADTAQYNQYCQTK
jgi:hypothetical protein